MVTVLMVRCGNRAATRAPRANNVDGRYSLAVSMLSTPTAIPLRLSPDS